MVHIPNIFHTPGLCRSNSHEKSWTEIAETLVACEQIMWLVQIHALMSTATELVLSSMTKNVCVLEFHSTKSVTIEKVVIFLGDKN